MSITKNNILNFFQQHWQVAALLVFIIITHRAWFIPHTILSSGDWLYWQAEGVKEIPKTWGAWINNSGVGSPNVQISFIMFSFIWGILQKIHIGYDIALKLTILIPLALLSVGTPYLFVKRLTQNKNAAFFAALFFSTITYLICRQTAHLLIAFVYVGTPLLLWAASVAIESKRWKYWCLMAIIHSVLLAYETRIALIATGILLLYGILLYGKKLLKDWKPVAAYLFLMIALNLYWVYPTFFGENMNQISQIANRELFGDWLYNLANAFTVFDWSWTGGFLNDRFIAQPIPYYMWIIPLAAFSCLVVAKKEDRLKVTIFAILSFLGILLTKQSADPFPSLYGWLYTHLPIFNLYREASKYYLITGIGYLGLIGILLDTLLSSSYQKLGWILGGIIACVAFFNTIPLLNQSIQTMFVNRTPPADYAIINRYLTDDQNFGRVLWVPSITQWGVYTTQHPRVSLADMSSGLWQNGDLLNSPLSIPNQDALIEPLFRDYASSLFANTSIRYVVVPAPDIANDNNIYQFYGNYSFYSAKIASLPYLKRIDTGTKTIALYEVTNTVLPHFVTTAAVPTLGTIPAPSADTTVRQISSSQYEITVHGLKEKSNLLFADSYSAGWSIALGDHHRLLTGLQPYSGSVHTATVYGLNSYTLDPASLPRDTAAVKVNPDKSLDVTVTIYYRPQILYYRGLCVSGIALLVCLLAWLSDIRSKKQS